VVVLFAKDNESNATLESRLQGNRRSCSYEPPRVYSLNQRFASCNYPALSDAFYTQFHSL